MSSSRPLLKSCENCRIAKAKCIPSSSSLTTDCERCIKYNKTCVYRESLPRGNRGKGAHTRIVEVEKKLDDLRELFQQSQVKSPSLPPRQWESTKTQEFDLCQVHKPPRERDAIDKEILSEKEAKELLDVYAAKSQSFPFIGVDPKNSLDMLRHEKPFLLLAVLTVSSHNSRSLQVLLEKELRETLATKVIVEGELSLDVLQGLMLYLAWYHYNFRPNRQQIYQLTQLCGSMVVDLELHRPAKADRGFVLHPSKACMACKKDTAPHIASETEALRTFIGAYYLTTTISIMLRKPNGLTYTPYLLQCCEKLKDLGELSTDAHLAYYVRLTQVSEEIATTFGYCAAEVDSALSHLRVQGMVQSFVTRAREIGTEMPSAAKALPSITSLLYTIPNLAYEMIFHLDARTDSYSHSVSSSQQKDEWHSLSIRTDMFLAFLDSVHNWLDWYVLLPLTDIEHFNLLDHSRIMYHLFLLGRLSLSGFPGSDEVFLPEMQKLSSYIEAVLSRYQELARLYNQSTRSSIYSQFLDVTAASRDWIVRSISERIADGETPHSVTAARIYPNFQMVSPWGIVDLDKDQVEEISPGFNVAAASNSQSVVGEMSNGFNLADRVA